MTNQQHRKTNQQHRKTNQQHRKTNQQRRGKNGTSSKILKKFIVNASGYNQSIMDFEPIYEKLRYRPNQIELGWQRVWSESGSNADGNILDYQIDNFDLGLGRFIVFQDFYSRFNKLFSKLSQQETQPELFHIPTDSDLHNFSSELGALTDNIIPLLPIYLNENNQSGIDAFANKLRQEGKPINLIPKDAQVNLTNFPSIDSLRVAFLRNTNIDKDCHVERLDIKGSLRYLNRLWRLARTDINTFPNLRIKNLHPMDYFIADHIDTLLDEANSARQRRSPSALIAMLMSTNNMLHKYVFNEHGAHFETVKKGIELLVLLTSPVAPHICAELWKSKKA